MTLREFLTKMDDHTTMYIGADNAYFVVGDKPTVLEDIQPLDVTLYTTLKRKAAGAVVHTNAARQSTSLFQNETSPGVVISWVE